MWKVLLSRKWIALTLVVFVLVPTFKALSDWQFRRLNARLDYNAAISNATAMPAIEFEQLSPDGELKDSQDIWRTVTATGTFLVDELYLIRKKSLDSEAGMWVVTPFKLDSGKVITVVRGWTAAGASATQSPELSALTESKLKLTGRLRVITTPAPIEPSDLPAGQRIGLDPKYGITYLELVSSEPLLSNPEVIPLPLPTLSEGSHRSYGIQWLIFIVMAVVGYVILLRNDIIQRRKLPIV